MTNLIMTNLIVGGTLGFPKHAITQTGWTALATTRQLDHANGYDLAGFASVERNSKRLAYVFEGHRHRFDVIRVEDGASLQIL